ncbi:MAG: hypothetical protein ACI9WL_000836 [Rubritalea sp.]|jgi:hypothetical protein
MKLFLKLFIFSVILISCDSESDDQISTSIQSGICEARTTDFKDITNQLLAIPNLEWEIMSFNASTVQSYNFRLSQQKNLCKIGYRSLTNENAIFKIQIKNNATGVVIYDVDQSFDDDLIGYNDVTGIQLDSNVSYSIYRTNLSFDYINNLGHVLLINEFTVDCDLDFLPITSGSLTIESASLIDNVNSSNNMIMSAITYIDVVFED